MWAIKLITFAILRSQQIQTRVLKQKNIQYWSKKNVVELMLQQKHQPLLGTQHGSRFPNISEFQKLFWRIQSDFMLVFFPTPKKKRQEGILVDGIQNMASLTLCQSIQTHTHISTKITGESYIFCPSFGCGSTSLRHIHHSQVGSEAFP